MEKKCRNLLLIEVCMVIFYLLSKFLIINYYFSLLKYFDFFFYLICFIYIYVNYGVPKEKNYLTRISARYIIILLLSYILIIYGLGCFTGFTTSIYDNSFLGILKNIFPVLLAVIFREIIRFIVGYNSKKSIKPIVLLTIIYMIFDIFNVAYGSNLVTPYQLFHFVCLTIIPTVAKQALLSYITYNISYVPSLIYCLSFEIAPYILPIYPNLGDYLNALTSLLFPFLTFIVMKKLINYKEKADIKVRGFVIKIMFFPLIIFLSIVIVLVSGIFNFKMIAIGSDSMNPIYYRGDAIIYEKVKPSKIKEGDILVFEYNHTVITHRVVNINLKDGVIYFQTKGDNNEKADLELVNEDNVLGKVRYIVKYIGYPTIWLNEKI